MCDYSLHGIPTRLAEEGETLVVHRFHTGSKGLTSPDYLRPVSRTKGILGFLRSLLEQPPSACAVCIPDGARLLIHHISPGLRHVYKLASAEIVTFRQLSLEALTYRDALEFGNGARLRLQELDEGQHVAVLALRGEATSAPDGPPMAREGDPVSMEFVR